MQLWCPDKQQGQNHGCDSPVMCTGESPGKISIRKWLLFLTVSPAVRNLAWQRAVHPKTISGGLMASSSVSASDDAVQSIIVRNMQTRLIII